MAGKAGISALLEREMKPIVRSSYEIDPTIIIRDLTVDLETNNILGQVTGALIFMAADLDHTPILSHFDNLLPYAGCTMQSGYGAGAKDKLFCQTALLIAFRTQSDLQVGVLDENVDSAAPMFAFSSRDEHLGRWLNQFTLLGGIAADNWSFKDAKIWTNNEHRSQGTVFLKPSYQLSGSASVVGHGWHPAGAPRTKVTRSEGTRVYELGSKSVIDFYMQICPDYGVWPAYPLRVESSNVLRSPVYIDTENGFIEFTAPICIGEDVVLCTSNRQSIIEKTKQAYSSLVSTREQPEQDFILGFSNACRHRILGDQDRHEFDVISTLSADEMSALVYLFGEFEPAEKGTVSHNQSIVITAL